MSAQSRRLRAYMRYLRLLTKQLLLDRSLRLPLYAWSALMGMFAGTIYAVGDMVYLSRHEYFLDLVMACGVLFLVLSSAVFRALFAFLWKRPLDRKTWAGRFASKANPRYVKHIAPGFEPHTVKERASFVAFVILDWLLLALVSAEESLLRNLRKIRTQLDRQARL